MAAKPGERGDAGQQPVVGRDDLAGLRGVAAEEGDQQGAGGIGRSGAGEGDAAGAAELEGDLFAVAVAECDRGGRRPWRLALSGWRLLGERGRGAGRWCVVRLGRDWHLGWGVGLVEQAKDPPGWGRWAGGLLGLLPVGVRVAVAGTAQGDPLQPPQRLVGVRVVAADARARLAGQPPRVLGLAVRRSSARDLRNLKQVLEGRLRPSSR